MKRTALAWIAALIAAAAPAEARVTKLEITQHEPFADGQAFGAAGAYEKIVGRFSGELDPAEPLNGAIVDLGKAPQNNRGQVEYSTDFFILKPIDLAKGNGALFYEVNNRGRKLALGDFNDAPPNADPATARDVGNGFLMRSGFTIVWSGWIAGMPNGLAVPNAKGLRQKVWDEFLFETAGTKQAQLSFDAVEPGTATLLMRERNKDAPTRLAKDQWEFTDPRTIRLLPAGTEFRKGALYQLEYDAENPPLAGIGFAATRDLVSFLRHQATDDTGTLNPLAPGAQPVLTRAIAHGASQSGRYLRDFLYRGFNEDETHRIVFDGMNALIATARIFVDFRFAQPNRLAGLGHGNLLFPDTTFPWAYETETDPFTGKSDGILARCTARNNCPKIFHTTSGIEYWQSGESLVTADPLGRHDASLPASVRIYHIAGTQHVGIATMPKGVCATPPNLTDRRPVLRALLLALDTWVKDGTKPPESRYPRLGDGSLVAMEEWRFKLAGVTVPREPNPRPRVDYGPDFAIGIIGNVLPEITKDAYPVLIPQVDADGNEIAGVRLPDISVPMATATGWAVRAPGADAAGELCGLDGSLLPFAKTKAERAATGDARLSLQERYADKSDYVAKVRAAAARLEADGFLLHEDAERIGAKAAAAAW
jgi:hypothetical protein